MKWRIRKKPLILKIGIAVNEKEYEFELKMRGVIFSTSKEGAMSALRDLFNEAHMKDPIVKITEFCLIDDNVEKSLLSSCETKKGAK